MLALSGGFHLSIKGGPVKVGAIGAVVAGRFHIRSQVASGGMGTVHRAVDVKTGRPVALKLLLDAASAEAASRFRREAQLLADVHHPAIVEFVDAGVAENGALYLAMEWIEGSELAARLTEGPLSLAEAVALVRVIAEALASAHRRGILHRDIKPQNVFLRGGDIAQPVLLDFGIATLAGLGSNITRTGMTLGTPGYMAPEQARGERALDARVDVYGLGCLAFQCISGNPPFVGPTPVAIVAEVLLSTAPRLASRVTGVPAELDELVASMLAKDPAQRPADGHEVSDRLRRVEATLALPTRAGVTTVSSEERRMIAVVAAVAPDAEGSGGVPSSTTTPMRGTFIPKVAADHKGELHVASPGASFVVFSSHESIADSAARAAAAALEIVATDAALAVSLVVGPSQVQGILDGQVVERAISMASRPGAIACDEAARGVLCDRFVLERRDPGFRLVGPRVVGESRSRFVTFAGRDRELSQLLYAFEEARLGKTPQASLVTAGPGLGKSRLLRELFIKLEQGEGAGALPAIQPAVIDGRAEMRSRDLPLALVAQVVRRGLLVIDGTDLEEQSILLHAGLEPILEPAERPRVAAFLSLLLGLPQRKDAPKQELATAAEDRALEGEQIARAVMLVLQGLSRRHGGLALLLDDVHLADAASLDLLARALRVLRHEPLLLAMFARPDPSDRLVAHFRDLPLERLQLAGLSRRAAERLVRDALDKSVSAELVQRIVDRGEGSPLFLQELLDAGSTPGSDELAPESAPSGVLASLEARLLRLDPTARKILRAASVFGETFWAGGVALLLGEASVEARALADWLVFLVDQDIVVPRRTTHYPGETELAFRHSLLRDAAYAMLTTDDRARGHRLAAKWFARVDEGAAAVIAGHLDAAGDFAAAAPQWARAARFTWAASDAQGALRLGERALASGIGGDARGALLLLMCEAHVWLGDASRAHELGQQALEAYVPGSQGWLDAVGTLAQSMSRRDQPETILTVRALVEAVQANPALRPEPAMLPHLVATALRRADRALADEVIRVIGGAALAHSEGGASRAPAARARAHVLRAQSWLAMFAYDYGRCAKLDAEALACAEESGDIRQACVSRMDLGFDLMMLGDFDAAERALEQARVEAARHGLLGLLQVVEHNLGFVLHRLGRTAEGIALEERCLAHVGPHEDRTAEAFCRRYLGIMHLDTGDLQRATQELDQALTRVQSTSVRWDVLARLAYIALLGKNLGLARLRIDEAMRGLVAHDNAEEGDMFVRLVHAEVARASGDLEGAREGIRFAQKTLLARAVLIDDTRQRECFLERIPEHRRILELARELFDAG